MGWSEEVQANNVSFWGRGVTNARRVDCTVKAAGRLSERCRLIVSDWAPNEFILSNAS